MTRKTLIDYLFPSKADLVLPSEDVIERIERVKNNEKTNLNSKTFVEYLISGNTNTNSFYSFNTYIEDNFEEVHKPTAGDLVIVRDLKNEYNTLFEGIISKQEGRNKEIIYKWGRGPYAIIDSITLKEAKVDYKRKGTIMQFYSPIKKEANQSVEEIEIYKPNKQIPKSYLPETIQVKVA